MDEALTAFREAAKQENLRRPQRRRYTAALQQQAVTYWQQRRGHEGVRTVATTLGISVSTLQRWTRGAPARRGFRRVTVTAAERPAAAVPLVITITAGGPRVEGLTIETAARLLTLLR